MVLVSCSDEGCMVPLVIDSTPVSYHLEGSHQPRCPAGHSRPKSELQRTHPSFVTINLTLRNHGRLSATSLKTQFSHLKQISFERSDQSSVQLSRSRSQQSSSPPRPAAVPLRNLVGTSIQLLIDKGDLSEDTQSSSSFSSVSMTIRFLLQGSHLNKSKARN